MIFSGASWLLLLPLALVLNAASTVVTDDSEDAVVKSEREYLENYKKLISATFAKQEAAMFSELKEVQYMTGYQLATILKLSYPRGSFFDYFFTKNMLADMISGNFVDALNGFFPKEIEQRMAMKYRFLIPSDQILSLLASDERILTFLGFEGCLTIVQGIMANFCKVASEKNPTHLTELLKVAANHLESFVSHFLPFTVPKHVCELRQQFGDVKSEAEYYFECFLRFLQLIPPLEILNFNCKNMLPILIEYFHPWLPADGYIALYSRIKAFGTAERFDAFRKLFPVLVKYDSAGTLIDNKHFPRLYGPFFGEPDVLSLYVRMLPIMRALMLIDDTEATRKYISSIFQHTRFPKSNTGRRALLIALNYMMTDVRFIDNFVNKKLGLKAWTIFREVLECAEFHFSDSFKLSMKLGRLHVLETLLYFMPKEISEDVLNEIFVDVCNYSEFATYSQMVCMLIAYREDITIEKLNNYLSELNMAETEAETNWSNDEALLIYNTKASSYYLIKQIAVILDSVPDVEQFKNQERIPFPFPRELFDLKLRQFSKDKKPMPMNLWHYFVLNNIMQMILLRKFGITFAQSRMLEQIAEIPHWSEVLSYANVIIERYRPDLSVRFYYPRDEFERDLSYTNFEHY